MRLWLVGLVQLLCVVSLSFSQTMSDHHVSSAIPVNSPHAELSAVRPALPANNQAPAIDAAPTGSSWKLLATLPGVIHAISFASPTVGFAAGEQGEVFKTMDGGNTWSQLALSNATSDYFYGVAALTTRKIIISGFYDSASGNYGVFRWSEDGGNTWTSDLSPSAEWLQQVHFVNGLDGIMLTLAGTGTSATDAEYTSDGGATLSEWASAAANSSGAWFAPQFSLLTNLHARASGINFCSSLTGGSSWSCGPSVDSVFDGPVFFLNDKYGWVGGGEISPNVEGWLHLTTNGGTSWSGRTLDGPWPIRSILFLTSKIGWAGGGNVYTNVGGVYFTTNGGQTWSVDVTTNSEMGSCAQHVLSTGHHQLWCAGFNENAGFSSVIYSTQY